MGLKLCEVKEEIQKEQLLLIAPYGIETGESAILTTSSNAFNCTLWDWNLKELADMTGKEYLLIAPYGIETMFSLFVFLSDKNF